MQASSHLRGLIAVSLLSSLPSSPALAQWMVAVEVGADRFWGGSIETTPERRSLRPYRPTAIGIGVERRSTGLGVGLRLRYMAAALGLEGKDAVVAVDGVFNVYSASPEVIYRLATLGRENQLLLRAGPLFELWSIIDEGSKARVGVQSGLSLSVPLGSRIAASVVAGAAVTASPFAPGQLDPNFEPRALWRREVAARLEYRL